MANPIVHFEIISDDGDTLGKFYSELFGWHVEAFPMPDGGTYHMIDTHAGSGINGGIGTGQGPNTVLFYAETPDPQKLLDKATKLGGKTVMPVTEIPEIVTFAHFQDPEGNIVGLVKTTDTPQGGVSAGSNPAIDWFEIVGKDPQALKKFYKSLFGWKISEDDYGHVEAGTKKRGIAGGIGPSPSGRPMTTVYANVDDLEKYVERAESLGAKTLVPPMDAGNIRISQFADPSGFVFGLYQSKS